MFSLVGKVFLKFKFWIINLSTSRTIWRKNAPKYNLLLFYFTGSVRKCKLYLGEFFLQMILKVKTKEVDLQLKNKFLEIYYIEWDTYFGNRGICNFSLSKGNGDKVGVQGIMISNVFRKFF